MKTVFMFPGQGAQKVGMGCELAQSVGEIAALYEQAGEIVGYDLAKLCFEGPAERLDATEISQPAIFVTSVACLRALRMGKIEAVPADIKPFACLGLSLGEYTALYAAEAMSFEDGLKLVQLRGRAMQAAARGRTGAMVSILGLDEESVEGLCQAVLDDAPVEEDGREPLLTPVNFNCPGQIVISGSVRACELAVEHIGRLGDGKAIPLRVAGAFHTEMMAPAAEQLREAMNNCTLSEPLYKVVANVDGLVYDSVEQIPEKLLRQLVGAVRWQQSIEALLDEGVERFIEIGPGRVLIGLVKKICRARKQKVEFLSV